MPHHSAIKPYCAQSGDGAKATPCGSTIRAPVKTRQQIVLQRAASPRPPAQEREEKNRELDSVHHGRSSRRRLAAPTYWE